MGTIGLVIPTYNEASQIRQHLQYHLDGFDFDEIVVVDGGSTDGTRETTRSVEGSHTLLTLSPGNRSRQLSEGVRVTKSDYLMFLHADSYLPRGFQLEEIPESRSRWGWFRCELDDRALRYRLLGAMISLRSSLFSSPTGDQAIWVKRNLLEEVGGFPELPLMEDVKLAEKLRDVEPGKEFQETVTTSSRRWKDKGYLKTILTMWTLKIAYYFGLPPDYLAKIYYGRTET